MKKLTVDKNEETLATFHSRLLCVPLCRLKCKDQNTHKYESNVSITLQVCEPIY
jgi:hypothetical protein